jgi:hypothetical protein
MKFHCICEGSIPDLNAVWKAAKLATRSAQHLIKYDTRKNEDVFEKAA